MIRSTLAVAAFALLTACGDGQPFFDEVDGGSPTNPTNPTDPTDGGIDSDGATPPPLGTTSPTPDRGIFRYEARNDQGGGLVQKVVYDREKDTFAVDGIGFDGANVYTRVAAPLNTLGGARVYQSAATVRDPVTNAPIEQIVPYRALHAVSGNRTGTEPTTSYAIVRTGGYIDYGFGGYVYERKGGVTLQTTGQASFKGDYAGLRVFKNNGGLEYVTGDMLMAIDFEDFNANDAVKGRIFNRTARDSNGVAITVNTEEGQLQLPTVFFDIREGTPSLLPSGEVTGTMSSTIVNEQGAREIYETGTFNGIVAGDMTKRPGGEIVGIITLESEDTRFEGVTAQETGGVILYRQ